MIRKSTINLFICFLLLPLTASAATNIVVKADRNPVALEESFRLIFEADGAVDGEPNFAPLKKDFEILSTSVGSNMSIINSRIRSTKTWTLTVFAKREGVIPIPAIGFGNDSSPATSITVKQSLAGQGSSQQDDVFVDLKVKPQEVYVQQQVIVKVKLYRSVGTANATLSEPELESGNAIIEHLDKDSEYETIINNRRYQVLERSYAVYPQESGILKFKPIRFQGQVSRQSNFIFDPFGPKPKTVVRRSPAVELTVKAIPNSFAGAHWLPAASLNLSEEWSKDPMAMQVDEPITRTINITANGLTASQLPVLASGLGDDFKQYPDQPVLETRKTINGSIGIRQEKSAMIPTAAGDFTLPEIRLPWWNTETNKLEYAVLPERTIRVLAKVDPTQLDPLAAPSISTTDINEEVDDTDSSQDDEVALQQDMKDVHSMWKWLSIVLAVCWLLTLLLWYRAKQTVAQPVIARESDNLRKLIAEVRKTCSDNDAERTKLALLAWAKAYWPGQPILSLGDIQKRCNAGLSDELAKLSLCLYGREKADWQGEQLWSVFQHELQQKNNADPQEQGKLEPLHRL